MAWTLAKHEARAEGILLEFHGDKTDPEGRPFRVVTALVPKVDPADPPDDNPDPAAIQDAVRKAVQRIVASLGDGSDAPKPTRLQRVLGTAPVVIDASSQDQGLYLNARS